VAAVHPYPVSVGEHRLMTGATYFDARWLAMPESAPIAGSRSRWRDVQLWCNRPRD
jgi:hypothetical protein